MKQPCKLISRKVQDVVFLSLLLLLSLCDALDAYSSRITLTLSRDYLVVRAHFSRGAQFLSCIMQIYGHAIWNIVCFYCMRYIQVFDSQVFRLDASGSCFALWHFYHLLVRWLFHITILELDTGIVCKCGTFQHSRSY